MPGMKKRGYSDRSFSKKQTFKRLMSYLFKSYKIHFIITVICIILSGIGSLAASVFMQQIIDKVIEPGIKTSFDEVKDTFIGLFVALGSIYIVSLLGTLIYSQLLAVITQGFLCRIRKDMFEKMESLPISYFDRHPHGEIMSTYTNDTDAIRQLISQSLPQIFNTLFVVTVLFCIMLWYSLYLTILIVVSVVFITWSTKKIGGGSAKYFIKQQNSIAKCEGFVEEMMNGQKVIKVFCHEEESKNDFEKINGALYEDTYKANAYANMLGPIIHNIGNILYVIVAAVGVVLYVTKVKNVGISSIRDGIDVLSVGTVITFLGMSRQFANSFNQISQQINSVVMGLAGADRIFELMDQKPEEDNGYVTLVNANVDADGNISESKERTGVWAWKHPHQADGTITYTLLKGDIRFFDVDFGYFPEKIVLHNVSIYAKPGQKIAFVGATGAGKTTITNLINRFYDIADGKIRYDGININKIKKADLRRSIGIVLQDTNLFTGTVMDNIKYGKLDATEEEVYKAAKIANAYDFITRLPDGFNTKLSGDGSELSQGQRQLLSIARAAIADAPVMILDEATSSIDTRTEALVSKGMDQLMEGRTVFVIAHRLSTVQNSNAIMVLDHGHIIERGDHDDLIAQKGTYYQLYTGAFELE